MKYKSTRGGEAVDFCEAVIRGIAPDRGLYVPTGFPALPNSPEELAAMSYEELAFAVMRPYLPDFTDEELKDCIQKAYRGKYEAEETVPVREAGGAYFLELYHGPTAAFKDMALQLMPRLLMKALEKRGNDKKAVILVSTSGDTGMAALKGFENVPGTEVVVFFPAGAVSAVQERQMRSAPGVNAHVFGIRGNFDDAQRTQKAILNDRAFRGEMEAKGFRFTAANSMNVGRLLPQIAYYVWGYAQLVERGAVRAGDPVNIAVPSGNFGNILAAYYAMRMGLPVKKLICASNKNKVLTDFLTTGVYDARRPFYVTNAPSMDILVSSNLERLLYHLSGGNAEEIARYMKSLDEQGVYEVSPKIREGLERFACGFAEEREILDTVRGMYEDFGYLMDTHTAVACRVWQRWRESSGDDTPVLIASTASPYKFAASVCEALELPPADGPFGAVAALEKASGVPVPRALRHLEDAPVLHGETIDREDMQARIRRLLVKEG